MEIKDLAGLSEPLTRLIEVVSKGVGAVMSPYLIRKNADAKAHEIRVISNALNEVAQQSKLPVIYKDGEIELWQKPEDNTLILEQKAIEDRSQNRLDYQSRKEQANIESVTSRAAIELSNDESIPSESPDDDWITRFFKSAQDVSSEEMQTLWGRILAGEIRQPGTYSLRTLDFVRNMTKSEAELLQRIGKYALVWNTGAFIAVQNKEWLSTNCNIQQGVQFALAEVDLMYPTDLSVRTFRDQNVSREDFFFGDHSLIVERGEISSEILLPIWKFTHVGAELLPLVPNQFDDAYLEQLGLFFIGNGGRAFIGKILARHKNGGVEHSILREVTTKS